jgi:hypothetical protein
MRTRELHRHRLLPVLRRGISERAPKQRQTTHLIHPRPHRTIPRPLLHRLIPRHRLNLTHQIQTLWKPLIKVNNEPRVSWCSHKTILLSCFSCSISFYFTRPLNCRCRLRATGSQAECLAAAQAPAMSTTGYAGAAFRTIHQALSLPPRDSARIGPCPTSRRCGQALGREGWRPRCRQQAGARRARAVRLQLRTRVRGWITT